MRSLGFLALCTYAAFLLACGGGSSSSGSSQATPLDLNLDIEPNQAYIWPSMSIPDDNPTTVEGVALGRRLFFDPILSSDDSVSCSSCHDPAFAFSDKGLRFSTGVGGVVGTFNAPALINLGWTSSGSCRSNSKIPSQ